MITVISEFRQVNFTFTNEGVEMSGSYNIKPDGTLMHLDAQASRNGEFIGNTLVDAEGHINIYNVSKENLADINAAITELLKEFA